MAAFMSHHGDWLDRHTDDWVRAGLVSEEQAGAIRNFEEGTAAPARLPVVAEVAAYLGSVLALMAGSIVVAQRWDDLTVVGRVALGAAIAVVGFVGGAWLVRMDEAGTRRLGGFLWTLAAGGVGMVAAILGDERGLDADDGSLLLVIGIPVLAVGVGLWRNLDRPLQLLTSVAGFGIILGGIGTALDLEPWQGGLVIWSVSVAFGLAALWTSIEPRLVALVVAPIGAWIGATMLMEESERWAPVLAAVTAAVVVFVGIREHLVPVLVVGVFTFLISTQMLLQTTLSGAGASLVVAVIGLAVVVVAVYRARPRGPDATD
jgi:uncharacterized membrane protein